MAFVSKVTTERRDLRELGHQMLTARSHHDDDDSPLRTARRMPLGIEASGAFASYVRCCAVVIVDLTDAGAGGEKKDGSINDTDLDGVRGRELWLGDRDGGISICLAVDGSKAPNNADGSPRLINQFPGTFVTAIGQVTFRDVWTCFQDGMIRSFDITTLKSRFEMKRHCGAITSIEVVESANIVATCSEDFLIYVWEGPPRSRQSKPSSELPKLIAKFAGHTNYVRAMCASPSGHHLFTGSADGTVRCYDLVRHAPLSCTDVVESNARVLGPNSAAVLNSRDARDVFYLFLHDVGSILGVVSKTAVTIYVVQTSTVHCVFEANFDVAGSNAPAKDSGPVTFVAALYCASTGQLWVSRSDGLLSVYDLHTYELSGTVDAHLNTIVRLIQFATCAATVRVVAASGSKICGKDSNSDVQLEANNQTKDDMTKLVAVFKQQREKRQAAERDLATQRRQYLGLLNHDEKFKQRAVVALERSENTLTQALQLQAIRSFVLTRKHQNQSKLCAQAMENNIRAHILSRYFHDWFRFWCAKQTRDAKRKVQSAIMRMAERSLQSRYLQMGLANLRRGLANETAGRRAEMFAMLLAMRKRHAVFTLWTRWAQIRRHGRKRADFSNAMLRYNATLARSVAWTALTIGAHNARTMAVRQRLATAICSIEKRALLRHAFDALMARRKFSARIRNRQRVTKKLEAQTANHVRSRYFAVLLDAVRSRRKRSLEQTTLALTSRLQQLESLINDPDVGAMSADQVSDLITTTQKQIDSAHDSLAASRLKLVALESYTQRMREEKAAWEGSGSSPDSAKSAGTRRTGGGGIDASNSGIIGSTMQSFGSQLPLDSASFGNGMVTLNDAAAAAAPASLAAAASSSTRSRARSPRTASVSVNAGTAHGDEGQRSAAILAETLGRALTAYHPLSESAAGIQQQHLQQQQPDASAAPVPAPTADATSASTNESGGAVAASWPAQRARLLAEYEASKENPSDSYRALWSRFHSCVSDSNTALAMWQVLKHSRGQLAVEGHGVTAETQASWAATETLLVSASSSDTSAASSSVTEFVDRMRLAREHPELAAAPPPPPPPPKPATTPRKSTATTANSSAGTAAPKTTTTTVRSTSAKPAAGGTKTAAATTTKTATRTASASAKPAAKTTTRAASTTTVKPATTTTTTRTASATAAKPVAKRTTSVAKPAPKR